MFTENLSNKFQSINYDFQIIPAMIVPCHIFDKIRFG